MTTTAVETKQVGRWSRIDARKLRQPAVLIFNPNAGHKLGVAVKRNASMTAGGSEWTSLI